MTASIENSHSSYCLLECALADFQRQEGDMSAEQKIQHITILMDSIKKCLQSLSSQVRFYESAKGAGRAFAVEHEDGTTEYVTGQSVKALRLPLPNLEKDAVIYGSEEALKAVASALGEKSWPSSGPAILADLSEQLAATDQS